MPVHKWFFCSISALGAMTGGVFVGAFHESYSDNYFYVFNSTRHKPNTRFSDEMQPQTQ